MVHSTPARKTSRLRKFTNLYQNANKSLDLISEANTEVGDESFSTQRENKNEAAMPIFAKKSKPPNLIEDRDEELALDISGILCVSIWRN